MRRTAAILAMTVISLTACGDAGETKPTSAGGVPTTTGAPAAGDPHADHMGRPTSDCAPSPTSLSITVSNTKFDKDCLAAPASQSFMISYDNRDSIAHNIAILESHMAADVLFRAEIFQGPKTQSFRVGALKPGTYAFHCEVHPATMSGTFIVK